MIYCAISSVCVPPASSGEKEAGPKLGNAPPPKIIFRGPLKIFSWMVIQKSEPRRGDAKLGKSGILRNFPHKNFAEFDFILEDFCAF